MGRQVGSEDLAALGWNMLVVQPGDSLLDQLLELMDRQIAARAAGRSAGLAGQVAGENPNACPACRRAWAAGHVQGVERANLLAALCGKPVVTVGLPL